MNKKQWLLAVVSCSISVSMYTLPPLGFPRSFEHPFMNEPHGQKNVAAAVQLHGGVAVKAYNGTDKVNPLHYLQPNENTLAMVKGFVAGTQQDAIAQQFNVNDDNGVRGRIVFDGKVSVPCSALFSLYKVFDQHWFVGVSLPVYSMKLSNLTWADQTLNLNAADALTKTLLTNNLAANVLQLCDGLRLNNWSKTGPGDMTVLGMYKHNFLQNKPWIKNVFASIRAGFMLPTGLRQDQDLILNMPFGNDGSVGLVVGGGLKINFKHRVDLGLDVNFLHTFNNTRLRRIKVHSTQTDFLLPVKTDVQKDPGFLQEFNLFTQAKIIDGFSVMCAYQYVKKGKDYFYVVSNAYSSTIANTAEFLKDWTMHSVMLQTALNWNVITGNQKAPLTSLFCKIPFNGIRSIQVAEVGVSCGFDF